ncbi:cholecystokinin receptor-like [Lytechinus pictus]|uniref:cholecystokinin receptor-like n=1 Tax=Lytechinus pictus TaxID=7653 RepID=UPI0030B9DE19
MNSTSGIPTLYTTMDYSSNNLISSGKEFETSDDVTAVTLTYYILVLILGIPANTVIIQSIAWKKRKTSTDIFILVQAIVDFVACIFSPAFIIRAAFPELRSNGLCKVASLAENSTAFASIFLTTVISIDRYIAVCRPLRRRMTVRMSILIAILCTVIPTIGNIPVSIFTDAKYVKAIRQGFCSVKVSLLLVTTITVLVLFLMSLMINTVLYTLVYMALRKRVKIHADLTRNDAVAVATISSRSCNCNGIGNVQEFNSRETHTALVEGNDRDGTSVDGKESKFGANHISLGLHSRRSGCSKTTVLPSVSCLNTTDTDSSLESTFSRPPKESRRKPLHSATSSPKSNRLKHGSMNRIKNLKNKKDSDYGRKTTRMLLIITIYFFVTWTPKIVFPMIPLSVIQMSSHIRGYFALIQILYNLRLTNHVINFFVYYLVSTTFRRDVKGSFRKYRCSK